MVARRRKEDEPFGDYREALKSEAKVEKVKVKGRWVWRSVMVHPEDRTKLIKVPPYRKKKDEPQ